MSNKRLKKRKYMCVAEKMKRKFKQTIKYGKYFPCYYKVHFQILILKSALHLAFETDAVVASFPDGTAAFIP